MVRQYLLIEIALDDQNRLRNVRHHLRRIEQQQAAEPGGVGLFTQFLWYRFPALVGDDWLLDAGLQLDLGFPLLFRSAHEIKGVLLLFEDEIGSSYPWSSNQNERRNLVLPLGGQHRNGSALAVSDHGNVFWIDILPLLEPLD